MSTQQYLPFGDIALDGSASAVVRRFSTAHPPSVSHTAWMTELSSLTGRLSFRAPAPAPAFADLESALGCALPEELRALWSHTEAITFDQFDYILYPPDVVRSTHESLSTMDHFMPLEHLIFIGGFGDGDQFAFGRCRSGEYHPTIFRWSHDTDSRIACSLGLYDYIVRHVAWRMTATLPP